MNDALANPGIRRDETKSDVINIITSQVEVNLMVSREEQER